MSQWNQRNGQGSRQTIGRMFGRSVSRRAVVGSGVAAAGLAAVGGLAPLASATTHRTSFAAPAARWQAEEGIRGGRLRIATTGQPAGLDNHLVAQRTIGLISWNMYEALFTFDGDYATVPMLAEGIEVSDDGLTNRIALRQGVPFHNGDEMQAADVVASFNRWAPISSLGLAISAFLDSITAVDPYTVEITLTAPLVALPSLLARQQASREEEFTGRNVVMLMSS